MRVQILLLPYDSGRRATPMGLGPEHLAKGGVNQSLRASGHDAFVHLIESRGTFHTEIATAFELNRLLAARIRNAAREGDVPLVLAGNCISSLGTVAALESAEVGVAWFDAHGGFNRRETTASGFLDGMALTAPTGRCWKTLAALELTVQLVTTAVSRRGN